MKRTATIITTEDGRYLAEKFPIVYREKHLRSDGTRLINIVYKDHVEMYLMQESFNGDSQSNYDAQAEMQMNEENGMLRVHYSEVKSL